MITMKNFLAIICLMLTLASSGQSKYLNIDGISKEVIFVDYGVDFSKTFVIIGEDFKSWENPFMLAGLQVGSYYYDPKRNSNICSGDYTVKFDLVPSWTGTITITDLNSQKVVGRIIIRNNWRFFYMPKPKHTKAQTKMLITIMNS